MKRESAEFAFPCTGCGVQEKESNSNDWKNFGLSKGKADLGKVGSRAAFAGGSGESFRCAEFVTSKWRQWVCEFGVWKRSLAWRSWELVAYG